MILFSGRANPELAEETAGELGVGLGNCRVENFPDDELQVEVREEVHGRDIYLLQPTCPPVADHLLELLLLADACRKAGAARLTAILSYYGYARQDRRSRPGEPMAARLLADLLSSRLDRMVLLDLHNPAIEGFFGIPVEQLSAVPLLAEALRLDRTEGRILVAPDLGAAKLAQQYADRLRLPLVYLHKERQSGTQVSVRSVVGQVAGRTPIIVDDMISTGGTIVSAIETLLEKDCIPEITVVVSHALLVGEAADRLAALPVRKLLTTDSLSQRKHRPFPVEVVRMAPLLAAAIRRLQGTR